MFFKFGAAPESVHIFTRLGIEPYGRIGTGIIELILTILLLVPKTSLYGAIGTLGVMAGAIFSHLLVLGINVNDGGNLFGLAIIVTISALTIVFQEKSTYSSLKTSF
uniref:DoxX family protein n=1 Tax=Bernardetia sp. ABR2-2B TaxID=3127472 RepID=UPI00403F60F9